MKLVNKKQGTVSCAGYTFEPNVPVDVPDELAQVLLTKQTLKLEVFKEEQDGKEKAKEEKR